MMVILDFNDIHVFIEEENINFTDNNLFLDNDLYNSFNIVNNGALQ